MTIQGAFPLVMHVSDDRHMTFPFDAWLCAGDGLASAGTITVDPVGLIIDDQMVINDTQVMARVRGGTVGEDYDITVGATTVGGDEIYRVFVLKVRD